MAKDAHLHIRGSETLEPVASFPCADKIVRLEWAADSRYVLCAQKGGKAQVWYVDDLEWTCRIDTGMVGLSHAFWSPDGQFVLTGAEFNLRLTVWGLADDTRCYIKNPKHADKCVAFSHSGRYLAVVTRADSKDSMSIYTADSWEHVKTFELDTRDVVSIKWSPNDHFIACMDTSLVYNVCVYSPDGHKVMGYSAYDDALGVKRAAWSPQSSFLAVSSFDGIVRVFNSLTWKVVAELNHSEHVNDPTVIVYEETVMGDVLGEEEYDMYTQREDVYKSEDAVFRKKLHDVERRERASRRASSKNLLGKRGGDKPLSVPSRYDVKETPIHVVRKDPDVRSENDIKMGVGLLGWSFDQRFLFTRNDNMPHTLWIWDMMRMKLLCVLNHLGAISHAAWEPCGTRIAICAKNTKLYLWSVEGCAIVDIPAPVTRFGVSSVKWSPNGTSLVLMSENNMCCCWLGAMNEYAEDDVAGDYDDDDYDGFGDGGGGGDEDDE